MAVKPWLVLQVHFAYCAPPAIYTGRINMALWKCYNELLSGSFFLLGCKLHPAMYHSLASQTKLTTSFRHVFSFCHHSIPSQKRALSGLNFEYIWHVTLLWHHITFYLYDRTLTIVSCPPRARLSWEGGVWGRDYVNEYSMHISVKSNIPTTSANTVANFL